MMYQALHLGPTREVASLGFYETYKDARGRVEQAVIQHRNVYGRDGTIGSSHNSSSRYPFRVEIRDCDLVDIYYVSRCV